jgi:hypothetical protein
LSHWAGKIEAVLGCLLGLQFVVVALHDLVDIPGWTYGSRVQEVIGRRKLWLATAINSVFPGLAVAFAIYFWNSGTYFSAQAKSRSTNMS